MVDAVVAATVWIRGSICVRSNFSVSLNTTLEVMVAVDKDKAAKEVLLHRKGYQVLGAMEIPIQSPGVPLAARKELVPASLEASIANLFGVSSIFWGCG